MGQGYLLSLEMPQERETGGGSCKNKKWTRVTTSLMNVSFESLLHQSVVLQWVFEIV